MNLARIDNAVQGCGLIQSGAFHPKAGEDWGTLVLLSPAPDFWTRFQTAPEATNDGDPIDTWSKRVITRLANRLGATPVFPFGGPPYRAVFGLCQTIGAGVFFARWDVSA